MKIKICDYSAQWAILFKQEKMLLEQSISLPLEIEHIGSTSVKGLCAKPIIDILIGVADDSLLNIPVTQIQTQGYEYVSRFENEMPYRRYFRKTENNTRTHQIHMVVEGSHFWIRHLKFRDYLRAHPQTADDYGQLKRDLAKREWASINDYANAKTDFIRRIESIAL